VVVPALTALLVLAACAGTPPTGSAARPAQPPPVPCLSQSDDGLFLVCLRSELDDVWSREFLATGRTYKSPQLTVGPGPGPTGDHQSELSPDLAYFSGPGGIHFPTEYLDDVRTAHGTGAHVVLTFTLGHETGHHVQFLLHPRFFDTPVVDVETQADCYAGFWARREADANHLDVDEFRSGAMAELRRLSQDRGEVRSHGDADQRIASLNKGLGAADPATCDIGLLTWR
jgi:predicted metalloprotease